MKEVSEVEALKKFKKDSGWSFQKIADLMGVDVQSVFNWFKGSFGPSRMAKEKIRRFLAEYSYKG